MEPMLVHKMPLFCYRVQIDCLPSTKSCRFVEEAEKCTIILHFPVDLYVDFRFEFPHIDEVRYGELRVVE